jgi:hypothetical protein
MELSIALARLVWEFDMRLAPDQHVDKEIAKEIKSGLRNQDEYQVQDWFLSNNYGPYAEFRARDFRDEVRELDSGIADCE